jgi:phosphoglycolate phosphatase-like HAD superfamily hydrolase
MIDCYMFDLDDTIIDSAIYSRMYPEIIDSILSTVLVSKIKLQETISKIKEKTGQEKVDTYELCKELDCVDLYYNVLEKHIRHTYTLKNKSIPTIFRKIKAKNKRLGIVTQSKEKTAKLFLQRFRLDEHVSFIASGKKETIGFWIQLENKFDLIKNSTMVVDDRQDILDIASDVGFKVLNVKNIEELEKFDV